MAWFGETAAIHAERVALRWRSDSGWSSLTWADYRCAVDDVANGLLRWPLEPGDRVAVLASNRPEWHIADMAILSDGLVTVPIYPTSAAGQVAYVLRHSGARLCVTDDAGQLAKVLLLRDDLPDLEGAVLIGDTFDGTDGFVVSFDDVRREGALRADIDPSAVERRSRSIRSEDLATIVYTSGTTGVPKGVMITHANLMAALRSLTSFVAIGPDDRFLSFLPLSHVTERTISHFGQIAGGAETWFARSLTTVGDDLRACRPTLFFAVPRVWEKFREQIVRQLQELRGPVRVAANRYVTAAGSPSPGRLASLEHAALDATFGRVVRHRLGLDRARVLVCGAAPVAPELLRWFRAIGLPVAEGYGSTEVTFSATANRPGATRIGTVGPPMPGVSVRVGPRGEILVRGDTTCAGYWHDEEATAALFDDEGWLHTGDLGHLDDDGYLTVTGREGDLIITSYGQNISPEGIESSLCTDPLLSQAVVIGDGRPYLTALVTLDPTTAAEWAEHTEHELLHEVACVVERVNREHAHVETIRRWRLLPRELTIAAGELTPTLKVRRHVVAQEYAQLIEEMYRPATETGAR